jgi:hypothetical protein
LDNQGKWCVSVNGYGLVDKSVRSKIEYDGCTSYLDMFLELIERLDNNDQLDHVFLCGAATNPLKPDMSEAASMRLYLKSRNDALITRLESEGRFHLEEHSLNTTQNIWYAAGLVRKYGESDVEWFLCCDNHREPRVRAIAEWVGKLRKMQTATVYSIERADIHPNSNLELQTKAAKLYRRFGPLLILKDLLAR